MDHGLIYDVGANNGDDTAHYLSKGFRVVAVEANPVLATEVADRFAPEVERGQLVVETVGIADQPGDATFYVNETNDEHSSFDEEAGTRGGRFHILPVRCVRFEELLSQYGVPHYLKVDIERADWHCIDALTPGDLPAYVSIEAQSLEYLLRLHELGYRQFKVIDQSGHRRPRVFNNETLRGRVAGHIEWYRRRLDNHAHPQRGFPPACSGPFGEETVGEWSDVTTVAYDWLHLYTGHRRRGSLNPRGWFDFHAKL